jgi:uncharacterized delta-60 repeat protein
LARYNLDGSLDSAFGVGGKLLTDLTGEDDGANAVVIQKDGRILAAGYASSRRGSEFALARYNSDGSPDNTFGSKSKVVVGPFFDSGIVALALTSDSRIIAAGYASYEDGTPNFSLARYNQNGSLDITFGNRGGIVSGVQGLAQGVALQPDGRIVIVGADGTWSGRGDFILARFNSNGRPDPAFGTGGKVTTDFYDTDDRSYAIAITPDGRIVVAGYCESVKGDDTDLDFALACYETGLGDGQRDGQALPSFESVIKMTSTLTFASVEIAGMVRTSQRALPADASRQRQIS